MTSPRAGRDPDDLPCWTRGGPAHVYVFACEAEDLAKIGFTRDPLARLHALHPRWYEFFDPARSILLDAENVHDARRLERDLKTRLRGHGAPVPLTIRSAAGGDTEWFRGALDPLVDLAAERERGGWRVHHGAQHILRAALRARGADLREWCARLDPIGLESHDARSTSAQQRCADHLDAYVAFDISLREWLDEPVLAWHRRASRALPGLRWVRDEAADSDD